MGSGWDEGSFKVKPRTFIGTTPCSQTSALVALYEGTGGSSEWLSPDGVSLNNWMGATDSNGDVLDQSADPYDSGTFGDVVGRMGPMIFPDRFWRHHLLPPV